MSLSIQTVFVEIVRFHPECGIFRFQPLAQQQGQCVHISRRPRVGHVRTGSMHSPWPAAESTITSAVFYLSNFSPQNISTSEIVLCGKVMNHHQKNIGQGHGWKVFTKKTKLNRFNSSPWMDTKTEIVKWLISKWPARANREDLSRSRGPLILQEDDAHYVFWLLHCIPSLKCRLQFIANEIHSQARRVILRLRITWQQRGHWAFMLLRAE